MWRAQKKVATARRILIHNAGANVEVQNVINRVRIQHLGECGGRNRLARRGKLTELIVVDVTRMSLLTGKVTGSPLADTLPAGTIRQDSLEQLRDMLLLRIQTARSMPQRLRPGKPVVRTFAEARTQYIKSVLARSAGEDAVDSRMRV